MREILFRGKRIDNGEWVYGYYVPACFGRFLCRSAIVPEPDGEWRPIEVKPETVSQYTGLTDKNGKKIFEGDIVKVTGLCPDRDENKRIWRKWRIGEVFYYHGSFYFGKWLLSQISEKLTEVIGNIHDNPKLLEDDK